jgi:hypothetical protein
MNSIGSGKSEISFEKAENQKVRRDCSMGRLSLQTLLSSASLS